MANIFARMKTNIHNLVDKANVDGVDLSSDYSRSKTPDKVATGIGIKKQIKSRESFANVGRNLMSQESMPNFLTLTDLTVIR